MPPLTFMSDGPLCYMYSDTCRGQITPWLLLFIQNPLLVGTLHVHWAQCAPGVPASTLVLPPKAPPAVGSMYYLTTESREELKSLAMKRGLDVACGFSPPVTDGACLPQILGKSLRPSGYIVRSSGPVSDWREPSVNLLINLDIHA